MMDKEEKIAHARHLIYEWHREGETALMCSFGKDSMVLLHLCREVLPHYGLDAHSYPIPIIFYRHPYFAAKHEFADKIIQSWALETYSYPPGACGIKYNNERLELVARYHFGSSNMDVPLNTEPPIARRDFVCGLQWLLRPKITGMLFPWRTVYIGHKSSDVDPFEGPVPLNCEASEAGDVNLVFPLRYWSDADVWDYLEENKVPYDRRRYQDRAELPDRWLNPDYIHACTRCIDPRNKDKTVNCPKLQCTVRNVGAEVLRLQEQPSYIDKERREENAIHRKC